MDNQQEDLNLIPIPFLTDYFVSKNGNIYSTKRNKLKLLKCFDNLGKSKKPYLRLKVANRLYLAHRLVASIHLNRELSSLEFVNHKNGNTKDNRLENLEVVSHKQNVKHAVENKLYCSGKKWYKARTSSSTIESTAKAGSE